MSLSPTRLTIWNGGAPRLLVLEGDIDSHTAPKLDAAVLALGVDGDVVVDLSRVGFVDSSGLRVLVTAHTALVSQNQRLVLRSPSDAVVRLFEITGLIGHLHVEEGPAPDQP